MRVPGGGAGRDFPQQCLLRSGSSAGAGPCGFAGFAHPARHQRPPCAAHRRVADSQAAAGRGRAAYTGAAARCDYLCRPRMAQRVHSEQGRCDLCLFGARSNQYPVGPVGGTHRPDQSGRLCPGSAEFQDPGPGHDQPAAASPGGPGRLGERTSGRALGRNGGCGAASG